ncbi:MAG: hypothetical protein J0J01_03560 [Reyranella sp.]|uniref:hypothetical protein n=1 Tax=Reyranella sp. TaxID=1929291 RepID=UPI001ACE20D0|nr:hypothetical protein [Reyranella sp.]MBN9085964.1 hypothetical protein [Reyranella sp.]
MNLFRDIVHELFGLFVDDGNLALAIVAIVVLAGMFAGVDAPTPVTGGILFFGCLLVLAWSVLGVKKN